MSKRRLTKRPFGSDLRANRSAATKDGLNVALSTIRCLFTMSLPGLNVSAPVPEVVTASTYELKEGTEWRFEVAFGTKVEVKARPSIPHILRLET